MFHLLIELRLQIRRLNHCIQRWYSRACLARSLVESIYESEVEAQSADESLQSADETETPTATPTQRSRLLSRPKPWYSRACLARSLVENGYRQKGSYFHS
jgi:hypothetical protein